MADLRTHSQLPISGKPEIGAVTRHLLLADYAGANPLCLSQSAHVSP